MIVIESKVNNKMIMKEAYPLNEGLASLSDDLADYRLCVAYGVLKFYLRPG